VAFAARSMPDEPNELSFSQRTGLTPVQKAIQIDSMDDALRNGLWNVLHEHVWQPLRERLHLRESPGQRLVIWIWTEHLCQTVDSLPANTREIVNVFRHLFFAFEWNQVYDLIDFVAKRLRDPYTVRCNRVLDQNNSAYRFVGNQLAPITSHQEVTSIEEASSLSDEYNPVSDHLKSALEKLSDRTSPDCRNSIKESISAVEAMCQIITGAKATLGQAVKKLKDKGVEIHPAFEVALEKMYGYTSDAQGIRHALLDESTLNSADALFILVSCSAFVNYLKSKSSTIK
jgi:AbiJ N-terminal domain 4